VPIGRVKPVRAEGFLNPYTAGIHEAFETGFALFVAWGLVGCGVTTEAKDFLVHDEINVFGESLDELPCLG